MTCSGGPFGRWRRTARAIFGWARTPDSTGWTARSSGIIRCHRNLICRVFLPCIAIPAARYGLALSWPDCFASAEITWINGWSRDGLPSDHITAILEDDEGDLWMSSENGIFGCSKPELDNYVRGVTPRVRPRRLTPAEGLVHKVCSGVGQPSACKSAEAGCGSPTAPPWRCSLRRLFRARCASGRP